MYFSTYLLTSTPVKFIEDFLNFKSKISNKSINDFPLNCKNCLQKTENCTLENYMFLDIVLVLCKNTAKSLKTKLKRINLSCHLHTHIYTIYTHTHFCFLGFFFKTLSEREHRQGEEQAEQAEREPGP